LKGISAQIFTLNPGDPELSTSFEKIFAKMYVPGECHKWAVGKVFGGAVGSAAAAARAGC
jgi:hypothetical protein